MGKSLDEMKEIRTDFITDYLKDRMRHARVGIMTREQLSSISGCGSDVKYETEDETEQSDSGKHRIQIASRSPPVHPFVPQSEIGEYCLCIFYNKGKIPAPFDIPPVYKGVKVF